MTAVYHLVLRSRWEADIEQDYRAASLDSEGFIHCSYAHQVAASANRFYADADELLVLEIDPNILVSPLRAEPASSGEVFPHVHGPINRPGVVSARPLRRDEAGQWVF
jgi:glutathione S-transferase